jgi:hypothetical protein
MDKWIFGFLDEWIFGLMDFWINGLVDGGTPRQSIHPQIHQSISPLFRRLYSG